MKTERSQHVNGGGLLGAGCPEKRGGIGFWEREKCLAQVQSNGGNYPAFQDRGFKKARHLDGLEFTGSQENLYIRTESILTPHPLLKKIWGELKRLGLSGR